MMVWCLLSLVGVHGWLLGGRPLGKMVICIGSFTDLVSRGGDACFLSGFNIVRLDNF